MEVNVKAVSEALDSILAEDAFTSNKEQEQRTSAIIQRRGPKASDTSGSAQVKTQKNLLASKEAKREAFVDSHVSAQPDDVKTVNDAAKLKVTTGMQKPRSSLTPSQSRPEESSDSPAAATPTALKTQRHSRSRTRERSTTPAPSSAAEAPNESARELFDVLTNLEVADLKVVEGTGLGVGSALVTPQNVQKRLEKGQLPTKSWVTNLALSQLASAVFELKDFKDPSRRRNASTPTDLSAYRTPKISQTIEYQDAEIFVLIEGGTDQLHRGTSGKNNLSEGSVSCVVTAEISDSPRRGFVTVGVGKMARNNFAAIVVPGVLLNKFVRITVEPFNETSQMRFIRVRALSMVWRNTWTSKSVLVHKTETTLEDEVEEALQTHRNGETRSASRSAGKREQEAENQNRVALMADSAPVSPLPTDSGRRDDQKRSLVSAAGEEDNEVAEFVKAVALSTLHRGDAKKRPTYGSAETEYNWVTDQFVAKEEQAAGKRFAAGESFVKAGSTTPEPSATSALAEYLAILQSWNNAPSWSIARAVEFCMSQTSSFSISTLSAEDVFSDDIKASFLQPFRVGFLVTAGANFSNENDSLTPLSLRGAPPPLHCLSAIASRAAEAGFTSELICTCETMDGFCCALRPIAPASGGTEEPRKLLLVVASGRPDARQCAAAVVAEQLLQIAFAIFEKFCAGRCQKAIEFQGSGSGSLDFDVRRRAPLGVLRMVLDKTGSFEALASVIARWCSVAGRVRYYGDATQKTLQMLLFPSHFARSGEEASSEGSCEECCDEALWSGLKINVLHLWRESPLGAQVAVKETLALELKEALPSIYVWQSASREFGCMRLVVTDAHFLECAHAVNGLILSPPVSRLAQQCSACPKDESVPIPPVAVLSEMPWQDLVVAAEALMGSSACPSATVNESATAAFIALRRRVTISFAFHVLSTAFKRGWASVGACVPTLCTRVLTIADQEGNRDAAYDSEEGGDQHVIRYLDEDAFMDTFVQWHYPLPKIVTLHCGTIFSGANEEEVRFSTESSRSRSASATRNCGVDAFFSSETLQKFLSVCSLADALAE